MLTLECGESILGNIKCLDHHIHLKRAGKDLIVGRAQSNTKQRTLEVFPVSKRFRKLPPATIFTGLGPLGFSPIPKPEKRPHRWKSTSLYQKAHFRRILGIEKRWTKCIIIYPRDRGRY